MGILALPRQYCRGLQTGPDLAVSGIQWQSPPSPAAESWAKARVHLMIGKFDLYPLSAVIPREGNIYNSRCAVGSPFTRETEVMPSPSTL